MGRLASRLCLAVVITAWPCTSTCRAGADERRPSAVSARLRPVLRAACVCRADCSGLAMLTCTPRGRGRSKAQRRTSPNRGRARRAALASPLGLALGHARPVDMVAPLASGRARRAAFARPLGLGLGHARQLAEQARTSEGLTYAGPARPAAWLGDRLCSPLGGNRPTLPPARRVACARSGTTV
jgi:hypothetical protein